MTVSLRERIGRYLAKYRLDRRSYHCVGLYDFVSSTARKRWFVDNLQAFHPKHRLKRWTSFVFLCGLVRSGKSGTHCLHRLEMRPALSQELEVGPVAGSCMCVVIRDWSQLALASSMWMAQASGSRYWSYAVEVWMAFQIVWGH
jgi:hypothetical protein